MVKKGYNFDFESVDEKKISRAYLANQPISVKYSTEFCRELKGKSVGKAEKFLNDVIEKKAFLPLLKYRKKVPHRRGKAMGATKAGRYPIRTAKKFLHLIGQAKANADNKGLDAGNMMIVHMFASKGFARMGNQAQGRISGKRKEKKSAHIEIVLREMG